MMNNVIATLVGEKLEGGRELWPALLTAPFVAFFHTLLLELWNSIQSTNPSMTLLGPDSGGGRKWIRGTINDRGVIYCPPCDDRRGIVKTIDSNTDLVTELDRGWHLWESCASALDGCIHFMSSEARHVESRSWIRVTMMIPCQVSELTWEL